MRHFLSVLLIFLIGTFAIQAQDYPEPVFPDLPTLTPVPDFTPSPNDDVLLGIVNDLPFDEWNYQLAQVELDLINSASYQRPSFIQDTGAAIGFVFWFYINREALLGVFAPIYYNVLVFLGWALSAASIYITIVFASAIKRIIQDFFGAAAKILSLIADFIPG